VKTDVVTWAFIRIRYRLTNAACWWLIFRVAHGILYIAGIKYLRTLAYFGSIGSLIAMACALI